MAATRGVVIDTLAAGGHRFAGDCADFEEILGDLLDNACKWAKSRVLVTVRSSSARLFIHVEDDGPGLDAAHREAVFGCGQRLDEHMPGSGLGLTIAQELAEA